jgi:hypothetical protein
MSMLWKKTTLSNDTKINYKYLWWQVCLLDCSASKQEERKDTRGSSGHRPSRCDPCDDSTQTILRFIGLMPCRVRVVGHTEVLLVELLLQAPISRVRVVIMISSTSTSPWISALQYSSSTFIFISTVSTHISATCHLLLLYVITPLQ